MKDRSSGRLLPESVQKVREDFRTILQAPQAISDEYVPAYYDRIVRNDGDLPQLSPEAVEKIGSKKGRNYVKGSNLLHRTLAQEYGSPKLHDDPHFLRTQMYESDAWLLIHLMDEAADQLSRQGRYDAIEKGVAYVNKRLFGKGAKIDPEILPPADREAIDRLTAKLRTGLEQHGDVEKFKPVWEALMNAALKETHSRSMRDYRTARRAVGEHSGKLSAFFIGGAGNEDYAAKHYEDRLANMHYSAAKIGAAAQLLDGYTDFKEDREEVMREFKPKPFDRSWFLYATVREGASLVLHEQRKHLGCFSGIVKVGAGKLISSNSKASPETGTDRFIEDLLCRSQDLDRLKR